MLSLGIDMSHPLVQKILAEGLKDVNVSMLSPSLRNRLLSEAGNRLLNQNRIEESVEAFVIAGNHEALRSHGEWFLEQRKFPQAALFLRHIAPPDELELLAAKCLELGHAAGAKAIYESLGDAQMVRFIEENF